MMMMIRVFALLIIVVHRTTFFSFSYFNAAYWTENKHMHAITRIVCFDDNYDSAIEKEGRGEERKKNKKKKKKLTEALDFNQKKR